MNVLRQFHIEQAMKWQAFAQSYAASARFDRAMYQRTKSIKTKRSFMRNAVRAADCYRWSQEQMNRVI